WFPGQEGGTALAEVLFGKVNPSGKLPMTFEKRWEDNPVYNNYHDNDGDKHVPYSEGIFVGYRGYDKLRRNVLYPFGFGLSYTTFDITKATVGQPDENGDVEVNVTVKNTGRRDGAQVVQVYVGRDESEPSLVSRPIRELRGFRKVFLKAGESADISITLPASAFTYYSTVTHDFVVDPGTYNISTGFSSRDIRSTVPLRISQQLP
ncbi:MAG: glycoside hydrolase family 3 C-terminal domain-containing protein, partial [Muribaculum sp.]|nr:glycoside hydrolase family 3 C-terminal domain-containing protein [Muribaculum sp.]